MEAEAKVEMQAKQIAELNNLFQELDHMNYVRRYTNIQQEKVNADQEKILDELRTELTAVKAERGQLKAIAVKRREEIEDMKEDLEDAYGCIQKLEQARIVLNKLMGPEGVITMEERQKFNLGMP